MKKSELLKKLNSISQHDITSYEFIHLIVKLINNHGKTIQSKLIKIVEDGFSDEIPFTTYSKEILFAAYYAIGFYYKRYEKIDELGKLDAKYRHFFSYAPLHLEIASWYYRRKGDLQQALSIDKIMMQNIDITLNAAPYISYASSVNKLLLLEMQNRLYTGELQYWPSVSEMKKDWKTATEKIQEAMIQYQKIKNGKKYGRHYAIYGSLLMCTPEIEKKSLQEIYFILDNAEENIKLAIQYENENEEDYFKRYEEYTQILNKCNLVRMQLTLNYNNNEMTNKINDLSLSKEKLEKTIEETQAKEIEIISIFTAVIAIILGGTQITTSLSLIEGEIMMLFLGGICLLLFSGLIALTFTGIKRLLAIILLVVVIAALIYLFTYSITNLNGEEPCELTRNILIHQHLLT